MSIAVDPGNTTGFATAEGLMERIAEWLDRTDLTDRIPDFIALAEARMSRVILSPDREIVTTLTAAASVPLPGDFKQLRSAHITSDPPQILEQITPSQLKENYAWPEAGVPRAFAIVSGEMILAPAPEAGLDLVITYLATISSLTASASNWLLNAHPDAYLYGSLLQAEAFLSNDPRLPIWKAAFDETIAEINAEGNRHRYSAAPIRLRLPLGV